MLAAMPPAVRNTGVVTFPMCRAEGGRREPMQSARLTPEEGVPGNSWRRDQKPNREALRGATGRRWLSRGQGRGAMGLRTWARARRVRDLPPPLELGWTLKPVASAQTGREVLPDGRVRYWIRHEVVRGVTPRMLVWWFGHMDGDIEIGGRRHARYRVWHPRDHIRLAYPRRLPDGSIGPGAAIALKEVIGRDPRYVVDIVSGIEKLDEEGFIHNPRAHGLSGFARMEYSFAPVEGGTLYENCLIFGRKAWWFRFVRPLLEPLVFPDGQGEAWLRHNIEEVGNFENFLPDLYRREMGLEG